jgi:integrase
MSRKRDNLIKTRFIGVSQHVDAQRRPTGWYELSAKRNHPRKPGKKWNLRVMVRAADAEGALKQRADRVEAFMRGERPGSLPSVRGFVDSWLIMMLSELSKSTRSTYANSAAEISAELGDFRLDLLRATDVVDWRERFVSRRKPNGKPYAPDTWNNHRRVGRTMYRAAMEQYKPRLVTNPFALAGPLVIEVDVDRDPDEIDPSCTMTLDQLVTLVESVRVHFPFWYPLTVVMATGATRFGEPTALKWKDIRFDKGEIVISKRQYRGDVGTLKMSQKGRRKIKRLPLRPEVAQVLRAHQREQLRRQPKGIDSGLVFVGGKGTGKPVSNSGFNYALKKAAKRAGLDIEPTTHWFRHTLNALMKDEKVSASVTKSITGHLSDQMYEHYGDVTLDQKHAAVAEVVRKVVPIRPASDSEGRNGQ